MTRMDSFPRGAAAWSVLFATISILAFAVPAHAQVTSLVVDFDDTDYRVVEGESVTVTVTLTPAADREVVIPIAATSYMLASFPAETGDYTVTGLSSGNLTFAVGDASKTFVVTANEDTELVVDDVRLDFGTLPSGVTSSRQSETYRAVVRILDNDFTRTGNAREDQPRDWSFTLVRVGADPEGEDIIWWIEGPEARYFHVLPVVQGAYVYGLFLVRPETMPDRDVKDTYEFTFYYSDGNEQSGADPGCSQTTPSNCRPDYRGTIKVNITDAPEISLDPSSVPEETATDVGVSLFGFQANDMVTFSVGGQCGTDGILSLSNAPTVTIGTVGTATAMLSLTAGAVPRDTDCEVVATGTTVLWGRVDTVETTLTTAKTGTNNPPTVASTIPDQSATAGTAFSYAFPDTTFTDPDTGDTLSYTATKADDTALPTWLAFAASTRTFSGTPQAADIATVSVKVTASDGNGGSVSDTFDITVAPDTTPPTLTSATVIGSGGNIEFQFSENIPLLNQSPGSAFTVTADGVAVTTPFSPIWAHPLTPNLLRLQVLPKIHQGQAVVVTYTDPTAGDDANAIQDTAGNDAATFTTGMNGVPAVTNNSTATNTPATGAPTITGTAQVGQTLTAGTTAIMDADGLTSVSYTYQWIRVATDNTETNISGATASTYTPVAADQGKTIKVKVSFTDDASNPETLTSAATAAVSAAPNTPPSASDGTVTTNEDSAHTFAASEFSFSDADGDTLSNVRIVTLPASGKGTLALSGTSVTANQVVPATNIGDLAYTPPANANGTGYASFTFKVSDGTAESAAAYTMTITVTAVNDAPTVANTIPDRSATAGTAFSYAFPANTFSDADTGDTLTYAATKADGATLPTWLTFAAGTRTFSGTPQTADVGTVSVKVTAQTFRRVHG